MRLSNRLELIVRQGILELNGDVVAEDLRTNAELQRKIVNLCAEGYISRRAYEKALTRVYDKTPLMGRPLNPRELYNSTTGRIEAAARAHQRSDRGFEDIPGEGMGRDYGSYGSGQGDITYGGIPHSVLMEQEVRAERAEIARNQGGFFSH